MNITQTITLDLSQVGVFTAVNAKQGDDQTRFVRAVILNGGMVWQAPEGTTAGFRCVKPDGHSCQNPAVINDDGTVTVELTAQVLAVPGTVWADICFINAAGEVLSTASFAIYVAGVPQGQNIPSSNEFLTLVDMVSRGEKLIGALFDAETGMGTRFARLEKRLEEVDQEQETAAQSLGTLTGRVEQLEQNPGGSVGVSSWEELTDKPFYETAHTVSHSFADTSGAVTFDAAALGLRFWKISDLTPTREQAMSGTYRAEIVGGSIISETPVESGVLVDAEGVLCFQLASGLAFAVCTATGEHTVEVIGMGVSVTIQIPEAGIYFVYGINANPSEEILSVHAEYTERKPLDEKFLPMETIDARIEEVISAALEGDY